MTGRLSTSDEMPPLPWATSAGDGLLSDAGPQEAIDFDLLGHAFRVEVLPERAVHSHRKTYRVECQTCASIIHEATSSATIRVEQHLRGIL